MVEHLEIGLMELVETIQNDNNMKMLEEKNLDIKVIIPREHYVLVNSSRYGLPAILVINSGLRHFKERSVFGWTCQIVVYFNELADNGMPTHEESTLVLNFFDKLNALIKGNENHPNALFVSRCTNDGALNAIWQVNDPKITEHQLQNIIDNKQYPREFDYKIEYDEDWKGIDWFLQDFHNA